MIRNGRASVRIELRWVCGHGDRRWCYVDQSGKPIGLVGARESNKCGRDDGRAEKDEATKDDPCPVSKGYTALKQTKSNPCDREHGERHPQ